MLSGRCHTPNCSPFWTAHDPLPARVLPSATGGRRGGRGGGVGVHPVTWPIPKTRRKPAAPKPPKSPEAAARTLRANAKAAKRRDEFLLLLKANGLPEPILELPFWPGRRFRFDFAWEAQKLALESEGGSWNGGGHTRGAHYAQDALKYSEAALRGWCVIRVMSADLVSDETIALVRRGLAR